MDEKTAISLKYSRVLDSRFAKHLSKNGHDLASGNLAFVLSEDRLETLSGANRLVFEPSRRRQRRIIDGKSSSWSRQPTIPTTRQVTATDLGVREPSTATKLLGDKEMGLRIDLGPVEVELWTRAIDSSTGALAELWTALLPGIAIPGALQNRVPVAAEWRDRHGGRARLELESVEHTGIDALPDAPTGQAKPVAVKAPPRRAAPSPQTTVAIAALTSAQGGADVNWIARQKLLDDIRNLVNRVASKLGTYSGQGGSEPAQIPVDWWAAVEPHLSFEDEQTLPGIRRVALYVRGLLGKPITSLTQEEADAYQTSVEGAAVLGRAVAVVAALTQNLEPDRLQEVADAEWAKFTEPLNLEVAPAELRIRDVAESMHVHMWDIDVQVSFGNQLLRRLEFVDDAIELELSIPAILLDFEYDSIPSMHEWQIVCAFLTAGVCLYPFFNRGTGLGYLDDLRLVFRLEPDISGGLAKWKLEFDEGRSSVSASVVLNTYNPLGILVTSIGSLVATLGGYIDSPLVEAISDVFKDDDALIDLDLFDFPTMYNATKGPPTNAVCAHASPGHNVLGANASAPPAGTFSGWVAPPSPEHSHQAGFAWSQRYLASWAYEHIGALAAATTLAADPVGAFGIELPDPQSLDVEEQEVPVPQVDIDHEGVEQAVANCERPAAPAPTYEHRTTLERTAPAFAIPQPGPAQNVGQLSIDYELVVSTVKTVVRPVARLKPGFCIEMPVGHVPAHGRGGLMLPDHIRQYLEHSGFGIGSTVNDRVREWLDRNRAEHGDGVLGRGPDPRVTDPPRDGGIVPGPGFPRDPLDGLVDPLDGRGSSFPTVFCEPPSCDWTFRTLESTLHVWLRVKVRALTTLRVVFDPLGAPWLPQVALASAGDSVALTIIEVFADGPFAALDRSELEAWVLERVRPDAEQALDVFPTSSATGRPLIPSQILSFDRGLTDEARNLIRFSQQDEVTEPTYMVSDFHVHWPLQIHEGLSGAIE